MNSIEFFFDRPLLLLILIPALAVILVPFFLLPAHRRKNVKKILPVVLHCIIVLLLSLILAGFTVVKITDKQAVLMLVDVSFSTEQMQAQMEERTQELLDLIHSKTPVGVVVFGQDQIYDLKLDQKDRTLKLSAPKGTATDIEGALNYLLTLAPEDKACRVILLSDGKQTTGKAEDAAYRLAEKGIRVDAYYFDSTVSDRPEMQISSLSTPEGAWESDDCTLSCEITSNVESSAKLQLYADDRLISEEEITTVKGSMPVIFTLSELSAGVHTYRVNLVTAQGNDTIPQNNAAMAALSVSNKEKLLILAGYTQEGQALADLLGDGFDVTVKRSNFAPNSISELCDYDGIIMLNVDYYSLPSGFISKITEYVGAYGRSLTFVGGRDTFMYGSMEDTIFEELSPVEFKLEESPEGATVAMMLVLDCSSSMKGEYLALAKQGAIQSLDALYQNDFAGVVSFAKTAVLESPLRPADSDGKEQLTRTISALEARSGTYYTEAINIAAEELTKCEADVKHILFLSDGQPSDNGYYDAVVNANNQGITVSTIGLDYKSSVLDTMAYYGKGRYHYVASAEDLADIMFAETEQSRINPMMSGSFGTVIKQQNALTDGLDVTALPPLSGYIGTTAKDDAEIHLATDTGHPLFSTVAYGFGKISCFTSDLSAEWSAEWFSNDQSAELIRRMLLFTRPAIHCDSSLKVSISPDGTGVKLSVNTTGKVESNLVYALLKDGLGNEQRIDLTALHSGLYEGFLQTDELTVYQLTVVEESYSHAEVDRLTLPLAVSWCREYDAFASDGKDLLSTICNLTGGTLFKTALEGANVALSLRNIPQSPQILFLVLCGLLFLIDVAIRRLRLKDLKEHFEEWKALFGSKKGR